MLKEKPETMKILMVTRETQVDRLYGLGRSLQPLIEEFRFRGIEVDYICQCDLGARAVLWQRRLHLFLVKLFVVQLNDTDIATLTHVLLERLNMGRVAAKLSARGGYTHVYCHDPMIAAGFRFFARFYPGHRAYWGVAEHGFGCYVQAIGADGVRMGKRIMGLLQKWEARTLLAASWVIAPTRSCVDQITQDLHVFPIPANWHCIYHARPSINHYEKQEARRQLGWSDDFFYVLGVGRIAPVKQFALLVEACARLKTQKSIQLVILGEGNHDDLQALGSRLGLTRSILFTTTQNVGLYLHAADLYVSTSISESFGLANLEALSAGTAAICSAVGGVPEVVGDGGILVTPDLEAFVNAMQQLLDNDNLRKTISKNALRRAERWPNIQEIANNYEKVFRQAATSQNRRIEVVCSANITDSN